MSKFQIEKVWFEEMYCMWRDVNVEECLDKYFSVDEKKTGVIVVETTEHYNKLDKVYKVLSFHSYIVNDLKRYDISLTAILKELMACCDHKVCMNLFERYPIVWDVIVDEEGVIDVDDDEEFHKALVKALFG